MDTPSDADLIARCLSGQTDAFETLMQRHQRRLFCALSQMSGSAETAQDLAQEAFVRAWQRLASFRGDSAFYSWLFRIALNLYMSDRRRHRPAHHSLDAMREGAGVEPSDFRSGNQPSDRSETMERCQLVQSAIATLPEEFRTALVLKEINDMSYDEIAEAVGCPIGTVRSRIHRARLELKNKLAKTFRQFEEVP